MSETNTIKVYKMKKVIPGDLLIILHPLSNPMISREVFLTDRNPNQMLPLDWALGVFMDNGIYNMYKNGMFTFDNNDALVKAAYEAGAYFDETLDFVPVKEDNSKIIFEILSSGNRAKIIKAIDDYGKESVLAVAVDKVESLSTGVVQLLESILKVQLTMDGGAGND